MNADLAQRHFMLFDPISRLVADMLEGEWNEELDRHDNEPVNKWEAVTDWLWKKRLDQ